MRFRDEATLIREANDSVFGLAAGILTRDTGRALRLERTVEAVRCGSTPHCCFLFPPRLGI